MNRLTCAFVLRWRLWSLAILLGAAAGWGFLLGGREGWAQQSPLSPLSPLATPLSVLPAPTPTPTSPLPPTNTPPAGLETWPTPTATPLPGAVQQAIELVVDEREVQAESLALSTQSAVVDPGDADAQLVAVQLLDRDSGERYWVLVDQRNGAAFPEDFSETAVEMVAEAESLDAEDLQLVAGDYQLYPFTEQLLWIGQMATTAADGQLTLALDLAGEEVDLDEVLADEEAAREAFCGVIEPDFCLVLRLAEADAAQDVAIVAGTGEAADAAAALLADAGVDVDMGGDVGRTLTARLPVALIVEMAALAGIEEIYPHFPDRSVPLDTNLILGFGEEGSGINLDLTSAKRYARLNYEVEATLVRLPITATDPFTLAVGVAGIRQPAAGPDAEGPATTELSLGELDGVYQLTLDYANDVQDLSLQDRYTVTVDGESVSIRAVEHAFTWPRYTTWLRLPDDSVWFVVQSGGNGAEADRDAFEETAADFYAAVEDLGAEPLTLAEGIYTHRLFVPPWPAWQVPDGEYVQVPVAGDRSFLFKWPDIRYFVYTAEPDDLVEVIEAHCVDDIRISGYTASGEVLAACQP